MDKLTQININFRIDNPFNEKIIAISKGIAKEHPSQHAFDNHLHYPHLTLYLFPLPSKNLANVIKSAKVLSNKIHKIELTTDKLITSNEGYLMLDFKVNEELFRLHKKTLEMFEPFREGVIRNKYKDPTYLATKPKKDQKYLKQFGHRFVLDKFHPHLTLACFENPSYAKKYLEKYKNELNNIKTSTKSFCIIEDDYETSSAKNILFESQL